MLLVPIAAHQDRCTVADMTVTIVCLAIAAFVGALIVVTVRSQRRTRQLISAFCDAFQEHVSEPLKMTTEMLSQMVENLESDVGLMQAASSRLATLTDADRAALEAVAAIAPGQLHLTWDSVQGPEQWFSMPIESAPLIGARKELYGQDLVLPGDWISWSKSADLSEQPDPARTPAEALAFITYLVRGDRFHDGLLAGSLESGTLQSAARSVLLHPNEP